MNTSIVIASPDLPWVVASQAGPPSPYRDLLGEELNMNSVRSRLLAFADDESCTPTSLLIEWDDAEEGGEVETVVPIGLARIIAAHILEQTQRVTYGEVTRSLNILGGRGSDDFKAAITGTLTPPAKPMRRPLNVTEDLQARDE